jgi:3-oxoacyl-(acyl-carrier-protein) synthase
MKAYITASGIISPQLTHDGRGFPELIHEVVSDRLVCIEPDYRDLLNPVQLRRMPRILKMGLAASQLCINRSGGIRPDAIIVGTGLGCLESLEKFLLEVINTNEMVTSVLPFINSTHNAVAAQVAMLLKNHGYNVTYCHRAFSFESALVDALMQFGDQQAKHILVGGIDECTNDFMLLNSYMNCWKPPLSNLRLLEENTSGTIAGEGSAFFLLSAQPGVDEVVGIEGVHTFLTPSGAGQEEVMDEIGWFLQDTGNEKDQIDVMLAGLNGDREHDHIFYKLQKDYFKPPTGISYYKHLCGEYYTSSSFALWLGSQILKDQCIPALAQINAPGNKSLKKLLIYNQIRNKEHALILLTHGKI